VRLATTSLVVLACVVAAIGCGPGRPTTDYQPLDLVNISGQVTLDGTPVVAAEVIAAAPNGSFSRGITDERGRYRLWFDSRRPGVTKGPKVVRIRGTPVADGETDPDTQPAGSDALPARYNAASVLRIEVSRELSDVDFNLHSVDPADGSPAETRQPGLCDPHVAHGRRDSRRNSSHCRCHG
jgi:hypothetical protein